MGKDIGIALLGASCNFGGHFDFLVAILSFLADILKIKRSYAVECVSILLDSENMGTIDVSIVPSEDFTVIFGGNVEYFVAILSFLAAILKTNGTLLL